MASVTIPGGSGQPPISFNVSGSSLIAQVAAFQQAIANASTYTEHVESNPTAASAIHTNGLHALAGAGEPVVSYVYLQAAGSPTSYTLHDTVAGTITLNLAEVGVPTVFTGSVTGGDSLIGSAAVTYNATAGLDNIAFLAGANTYNGDSTSNDTIFGGAGYDIINTGTGSGNIVFSGAGNSVINLQDLTSTVAGSIDLAYLGDGHATVNASGVSDVVLTGTGGQVIFGTGAKTSSLVVAVAANATATGAANDIITAGAATTTIFDSVGGNSIFGGTGSLTFIGGSAASSSTVVADTIVGTTGSTVIFGSAQDSITFSNSADTTSSVITAVAGVGNETLNGANALHGFQYFGNTSAAAAATIATSVIGGSGYNTFATGTGSETLVAGSGTNIFYIDKAGASSHITIVDFSNSSNDFVQFATASTSSVAGGNLTITLSDSTTVEFLGITSLAPGHVL